MSRQSFAFKLAILTTVFGQPTVAQQVDTSTNAGKGVVEDVVVTASRRAERLQDVPIAVTALTADDLQNSGISSTRELTQAVPSLYYANAVTIYQPTIRGVGSKGTSPGDESSVSTYVDGVYQPVAFAGQFDLLQVERVEVLRGPQGTLFGRNATGGLINVITTDPSFDTKMDFRATYASFDERSFGAYVTTGLTDALAVDLSGYYVEDNGYVHDLVRGGTIGARKSEAFRSKMLYKSAGGSRVVLSLNYFDTDDDAVAAYAPINGNTSGRATSPPGTIPDEPYEAGLTFVPRTNVNQFGASLQTETPLEDMRFETTLAYQRNKLFSLTDSDASPAPQSFVEAHNSGEAVSAELRLLSDSDSSLQWILGTFYFDSEEAYKPLILSPTLTQNSGGKTTSVAGFGEGTWRFSEQWRLTAGLRYTWEDRTFDSAQNGITLVDNEQTSFDRWSPRVSLQFQPSDKTNLYVTASQGFKSGVFNTASTNRTPVDPEVLTAYEIGVKSDPFDWLRVNAAAFTYVYDDMQFSARDSAGLTRLLNVGEASIEGVELEIIAAATRSLTLRLSGSYVDAIYENFPNAPNTVPLPAGGNATNVIDASGNQTIKFPKWSYNLAARYSMDVPFGRMDVSANLYDSATIYYDPNNRLRQPGYTLVNAEISLWLRDETIKLAVFGRNLTDEEVYNTVVTSTRGDYGTLAKPRVIGVSAELRFR